MEGERIQRKRGLHWSWIDSYELLICHDIDKNEFSFLYSGSRWSVVDSYGKFKVSFPGGKSSDYRQSNPNKIMRLSYTQVFAIFGQGENLTQVFL